VHTPCQPRIVGRPSDTEGGSEVTHLRTRPPTRRVPWPLILIEGGEKSGKSWACAELSASPRVGQTYWLDLGEGAGDEYGAIPGARYLVIDHDGSWADIIGQVEAVRDEARRAADAGQKPVAIVIDSATAIWDMLKDWVTARAKRYDSNQRKLRANPDAEIQIPMNLWNDANARWRRLMTILMTFPGIAVVTARGKDVAALDSGGRPIANTKEYKVEGQKNLAFDATAWVRVSRDQEPIIVGARSVHAGVRPGTDRPRPIANFSLDWLIFEHLRCDPTSSHVRNLVEGRQERTPEEIRDAALASDPVRTADQLRADYSEARRQQYLSTLVRNERDADEELGALLIRIGQARTSAAAAPAARNPGNDPRRRRMFALLSQAEITDRDERLAYCSQVTGRDVTSTNDLSDDEVAAVCERLESYIAQSTPAEPIGADA
jgi:AAA domain